MEKMIISYDQAVKRTRNIREGAVMAEALSKFTRQLLIFAKFYTSLGGIEFRDLEEVIAGLTKRTLNRDIDDLKRAGLIDVYYDRGKKSYVNKSGLRYFCPYLPVQYTANAARNMHLDKLIRLVKFIEWTFDNVQPSKENYTSWYKTAFPVLSERTMKRDVQELEKIGIYIYHEYSEEFNTSDNSEVDEFWTNNNIECELAPNCYYVELCEFHSMINLECW